LSALGSSAGTSVDFYGHIGGWLTGLFLGMVVMIRLRGQMAEMAGAYEKKVKYVGLGLFAFFFVLCFTLLFTVRNPPEEYDD